MKKNLPFVLAALAATAAAADYEVTMNAIDAKGVGAPIGTVTITQAREGVELVPNLKNLPPGRHGFHVHEDAGCGAREKDGKMSAGEMAGEHYDPTKSKKHAGPDGQGHRGDLPVLEVDFYGAATTRVLGRHLTLRDLEGKSLVVHEGGDNYSDQPKPNGGGGTRIACGVIQPGEK